MGSTESVNSFPYPEVAVKLALALGIGLLVGLEREWSRKEVGVRTFAITSILGALAEFVGLPVVVAVLMGVFLLVALLNAQSLRRDGSLETTTSASLITVYVLGVLVGQGHFFTAATSAILTTMLLAWKSELVRFAGALQPTEIRGAVLLGLLSFVVYPLLPNEFVDAWQLVNPRQAWVAVVVIAGLGFLNYVLLKLYSARGLYYAALLGGLVNSTAAVAELSSSFSKPAPESIPRAVAVLLLTTIAMCVRNLVLFTIFAPAAADAAAPPLLAMAGAAGIISWLLWGRNRSEIQPPKLSSPVSLRRVLTFGLLFLALAAIGTLAQRYLGRLGFLAFSTLGGLVSSASTTASAASLATSGKVLPETAALAAILTSMASALVDLPLVYQQTRSWALTARLAAATWIAIVAGVAVSVLLRWI
jgi:uncharacterized membrane protein (DUF4010 family)